MNYKWVKPTQPKGASAEVGFNNWYAIEHRRNGEVIGIYDFPNGVVNEGKDHMLDATFLAATTQQVWYASLITGTGTLADTDTMSSHAGWDEFTSYASATRLAWGPDSAASQSITNSTPAEFAINATGTVKGAFLTSDNTKAGTTGILFSTALATPEISVLSGDTLRLTYAVNLT